MKRARGIAEVRAAVEAARRAGARVGLVPTMGAFHAGHLSLMRRARTECGFTVVSLFVNPTQFNDLRDLQAYPQDEERDAAMAEAAGVDLLFAPSVDEMYGDGAVTSVSVAGLTEMLEGASRGAAHFRGVATVVSKLFNIVQPAVAYFGQKDAQQVLVIRRMVRDLDFPVDVQVCPTVRETDGLALSSRNARLGAEDRGRALALHGALLVAADLVARGERGAGSVAAAAIQAMRERGVEPEYFVLVSPETLKPIERLTGRILAAVAATVGPVRLIDNVLLDVPASR